jgi:GTP-binding protein Era
MTNATPFRAGFVAIIGRANVGKSTLLNAMLGQKLAIVSPKPHTTRHKVLGVLNGEGFQAALLDTPGFLRRGRDQLDAAMSRQLASALAEADLALLVVEPRRPGDVERDFMRQLALTNTPTLLVINKVDTVSKKRLLPIIQGYAEAHKFQEVVPVSAVERDGVELLLEQIAAHLPEGEAVFPPEVLTDRPVRFLCAEIIREKVFLLFAEEVPYAVTVEVDAYEEREDQRPDMIAATVYVDSPSQKQMLIGKAGAALKEVGTQARVEIEELVGKHVYVELWVKVNQKWRRKAGFVQAQGYGL